MIEGAMRDRAQALDDVVTAAVLGDALAGRDVQRAEAEFIDGGLALTVGRYTVSLLEQVATPLPPWEGLPECFYSDCGCVIEPRELMRQRSDGVEALAVGIALARAFVPLGGCADERRRRYVAKIAGHHGTPAASDAAVVLAELLGGTIANGHSWIVHPDWDVRGFLSVFDETMTATPVWLERLLARYEGLHGMGLAALDVVPNTNRARSHLARALFLVQESGDAWAVLARAAVVTPNNGLGMTVAALLAARVEELGVLPLIDEHPLGETARVVIEAARARGE